MNRRKVLLALIDSGLFVLAFLAMYVLYLIRGEGASLAQLLPGIAILFCVTMISRLAFRVYRTIWRHSGAEDYLTMVVADATAGAIGYLLVRLLPISRLGFFEIFSLFTAFCLLSLASRFCYRYLCLLTKRRGGSDKKQVAIVGAGSVGMLLAQELIANKRSEYVPYCFFDKDSEKIGGRLMGLRVFPEDENTMTKLASLPVDEVFIAIPSLSSAELDKLHKRYAASGLKVKLYDLPLSTEGDADGKRRLREIHIEDLLFRDSLMLRDDEEIMQSYYRDKVVLVTGGGGSIGSELCRQIAALSPKQLIILDIYENNAYDIEQELRSHYGDSLNLSVEIASVRDRVRLNAVFAAYRPEVVFHAAAHKHVPLMEHSPAEAIKNNVFGTMNTADMAEKYQAEKFILISTDKAVNPTNVMGASKRLCEMVVQCRTDAKTQFAAVRFGNVLGSNGSVIPLFRRQIEEGGPITITDKRIIRYFMTIPEASSLVMCAGARARGGELFVLNMGRPVKILELAEKMVRLSGLVPYQDIDITEVGLRPGEKLYEELLMKTEELDATENKMIFIERDTPYSRQAVAQKLDILADAISAAENELCSERIREAVRLTVPTYKNPDEVNRTAAESEEMKMIKQ